MDIFTGLHILLVIFLATYVFLFKKSNFDYAYLIIIYLILLHWTFFNGECVLTYLYKKLKDPDYSPGFDPNDNEVKMLFNLSETSMLWISLIDGILVMSNIILISIRNRIWSSIYLSFILLFLTFLYATKTFTNHHSDKEFLFFQEKMKYLILLFGILCLWLFNRRFKIIKGI